MTEIALIVPAATGPDQRQNEILDAIRQAFIEKGFDGASMQDLARAAGMSVGNFYRYFASKSAIVEAIVLRDLADIERDFHAIIGSDQPVKAMLGTIRRHITDHCSPGDHQLWAEITAAAARKPEIAAVVQRMEAEIVGYVTTVLGLVTNVPTAEAQTRFGSHAILIMMLVKASGMRPPALQGSPGELNELILRTINRILDEIAATAVKV